MNSKREMQRALKQLQLLFSYCKLALHKPLLQYHYKDRKATRERIAQKTCMRKIPTIGGRLPSLIEVLVQGTSSNNSFVAVEAHIIYRLR